MSVFSALPGAVSDGGLVAHFGDPLREQRALARGAALSPLTDRTVLEVAGPDRLSWLDSITSQSVAALAAGQSAELLVLDPQGRIEHAAAVFEDGTSTWLLVDEDDAEALAAWLQRMVFRAAVTVAVRTGLVVIGFFAGGAAEQQAERVSIAPHDAAVVWADPWSQTQPGGHQYYSGADHPGAGYRWRTAVVDEEGAAALAADPGVVWAGALAAEALRIAAWRPRWATEVDERSLPHETDWIRTAVHLNKGCYRGQETVAKVHNLGHPPRRLAALHLDGSDDLLPERNTTVFAEEVEVGRITSAARHHELGPIALAILSRRAPAGDLAVRTPAGDIAAAQEIIVPVDAGATAEVPRLTRLSRRPTARDPREGA